MSDGYQNQENVSGSETNAVSNNTTPNSNSNTTSENNAAAATENKTTSEQQQQQQASKNESASGNDGGKQQATAGIPGKDDERKLFVGGLTRNTTESELREFFCKFGEIESVSIKMDPYTRVSRGFAFMVFQNPKAIDKLLAAGDHYINKRKVYNIKIILYFIYLNL